MRTRPFAARTGDTSPIRHTHFEVHRGALLDAGFREGGMGWQHLGNRVLTVIR